MKRRAGVGGRPVQAREAEGVKRGTPERPHSSQSAPGDLRTCLPGRSLSLSRLSHPVPAGPPPLPNRGPETAARRLLGQPPWPGPGVAGLGHGERVLSGLHHVAPALSRTEP